jgi:muconolactone delta-isomerase
MLQQLVPRLAAASVLVAATPGALAQTPPSATPTTKILAIGTFAPGTDMQLVERTLAAEVRATTELYLEGKIDQWWSLESRPGVVFILNVTDIGAAQAMLEALPLGKAHLMTFELYPVGPLKPLRRLLKSPEAH